MIYVLHNNKPQMAFYAPLEHQPNRIELRDSGFTARELPASDTVTYGPTVTGPWATIPRGQFIALLMQRSEEERVARLEFAKNCFTAAEMDIFSKAKEVKQ